jgi:hypothetical protein
VDTKSYVDFTSRITQKLDVVLFGNAMRWILSIHFDTGAYPEPHSDLSFLIGVDENGEPFRRVNDRVYAVITRRLLTFFCSRQLVHYNNSLVCSV